MSNIAYHRTNTENAPAILKNGILSFKSQGFSLNHPRDCQATYTAQKTALEAVGFSFRIPSIVDFQGVNQVDARCMFFARQSGDARSRVEATFVTRGGVSTCWSPDGVTIAVNMDKVQANFFEDDYNTAADGCMDMHICGDIPADAIMGIVTDAQIKCYGDTVQVDRYNGDIGRNA
tara:strand:+ start:882 stop:1409 length:528 start_codon:yes stop_codon:yes gene_type:complete